MKNLVSLFISVCLLVLVIGCAAPTSTPATTQPVSKPIEKRNVTWASVGVGSSDHLRATAWAAVVNKYSDKVKITVTPAQGSIDAARKITEEKVDITSSSSDVYYSMKTGTMIFKDVGAIPSEKLPKAIFYGYGMPINFIAEKDSPIKTIADLKDKVVAGQGKATVSAGACKAIIDFYKVGCDFRNLDTYEMQVNSMVDKIAHAWTLALGYPGAAITELASRMDIRLMDIKPDPDMSKYMYDQIKWVVTPSTIPAGTYKGQNYDVHTVETELGWIVAYTVPDDIIYEIVSVAWKNMKEAEAIYVGVNQAQPRSFAGYPIHPAAKRALADLRIYKGD